MYEYVGVTLFVHYKCLPVNKTAAYRIEKQS